jgi:phenylalanyl-tRNA synthetase beta chain
MKIPLGWLREFVDIPVEPRKLADDLTLVGLAVDGIESFGSESVLDLDITTNRVDAMNVLGVAREVSVRYGAPLRLPEARVAEAGAPAGEVLRVEIEAPELCPRFCARVLDVRLGPSPDWLRDRLEMVGVRPISNIVDVTNYVMMELGQPSHAFDLARIPGGTIRVRWGREGERLQTLDGAHRTLSPRIGTIGGVEGPLGLAGIMGGAASEVRDETRVVALEAASWNPLAVRRAAKALGMHTEASHRFERGSDPELPPFALDRIAFLLARINAGTARPGLVEAGAAPGRARVGLRREKIRGLLGMEVPEERVRAILEGLGFRDEGGSWVVPSFRGDVRREVDLIEEVARHYGLDKVPPALPAAAQVGRMGSALRAERDVQALLVGFGLTEVMTLSFVTEAEARLTGETPVLLENPLSEEQGALRNSLVVPGLVSVLRTNLRQGRRDVAVFETGRVYRDEGDWPPEERRLGILLSGSVRGEHWGERPRPVDVFDLKGILEAFPARLRVRPFEIREEKVPAILRPGRSAALVRDGRRLGFVGVLGLEAASRFDIKGEVVVAELSIEALFEAPPGAVRVLPLGRFPVVHRDVSAIVDQGVPSSAVVRAAREGAGSIALDARIVARYEDPASLGKGRVSLTVALRLGAADRTLTNEEAAAAIAGAVRALKHLGAEIRGTS